MNYKWKDTSQYLKVYQENPFYGMDGGSTFDIVSDIIKKHNIYSIFDFGCGPNAVLLKKLSKSFPNLKLFGYDPASINTELVKNEIDNFLRTDLVVSTDCLEHVPKEELGQCWNIFNNISPKFMFHVICTRKAGQILPDGTNAHKTVESPSWWESEIKAGLPEYDVVTSDVYENTQHVHFLLKKRMPIFSAPSI